MQQNRIPYSKTGKFSSLVLDFLNQSDSVKPFFNHFLSKEGFEAQMQQKGSFSSEARAVLVKSLHSQYELLKVATENDEIAFAQINSLKQASTFTITTGHQLCLFTGPLYTVYKILHIIKLADSLKNEFPDRHFVPVFWMATEDHDFEEVNHIRYNQHKFVWRAQAGDAVGRIPTHAIERTIDELAKRLPEGERANEIIADLESAYLQHENLADATRMLVHKWFGKYGVICLDGDDAELKKAMIPAFKRELVEELSSAEVEETNKELTKHYKIQVTPRDINLFYLRDGLRNRIIKNNDGFAVVGQPYSWTEEEIISELESHPERFSPNVILRPLYQESILPNLAYIGGGGEVAYWAQLKSVFNAFNVPFPIVVLRQSVQLVPKRIERKRIKLKLSYTELFREYQTISTELIKRDCDFEEELAPFRERMQILFNEISTLAGNQDSTLIANVEAQRTHALKRLLVLEKKLMRSAKRQDSDTLRMLQECKNVLMPGGGLQERHDNIVQYLVEFGYELFDEILSSIEPFNPEFISLNE